MFQMTQTGHGFWAVLCAVCMLPVFSGFSGFLQQTKNMHVRHLGWIPAGVTAAWPGLTSEPVVQHHVHRVLHDRQELGGEQRVPLPPVAVHPAVPQLHHQTQLPQGEGLWLAASPQSSHRLRAGERGTTTRG